METQQGGRIEGNSQPKTRLIKPGEAIPGLKAAPNSRLSFKGNLFYYSKDNQPIAMTFGFSRSQETEEQAFSRTIKVGEEWVKLEVGWIKTCSGLLLVNEEGRRLQRVPDHQEREDMKERIVEICLLPYEDITLGTLIPAHIEPRDMHSPPRPAPQGPKLSPLLYLPPGETSGPLYPVNVHGIYLRCRKGSVKVTTLLIPA